MSLPGPQEGGLPVTVPEILERSLAVHKDRVAVCDASESLTYGELHEKAELQAERLRDIGVGEGDPVGVVVSNSVSDMVHQLAIWRLGGVVVPVHYSGLGRTVRDRLDRTRARVLVGRIPSERWSDVDLVPISEDVHRAGAPGLGRDPILDRAALVIFTSGSTGLSKGVVLSHTALAAKLSANQARLRFSTEDRVLLVLQLTFSFGQWVAWLTLATGGTLRLESRFTAHDTGSLIRDEDISRIGVVPTMLRQWRKEMEASDSEVLDALRASRLRLIITGGEPLGAELGRRMRTLLPAVGIADVYGLTETCTSDFILQPEHFDQHPGTIGVPGEGVEYRIVDDHGGEVAAGGVGELLIRTPYLMNGYLGDPEQTEASMDGGYFKTGDLARTRDGGIVELAGRRKDLIIRGANKVSPLEIERVFAEHEGVREAVAVGIPDPVLGEAIGLLVVQHEGTTLHEADLTTWAASRLERYLLPDVVVFDADVPLGATGKVSRVLVRERIMSIAKPAGGPADE